MAIFNRYCRMILLSAMSLGLLNCEKKVPEEKTGYAILACNPLTGTMSFLGPSLEHAMVAAADVINSSGGFFNEVPLNIISVDTHSDLSSALSETQFYYLEKQNQVVGLAGAYLNHISRKLLDEVATNDALFGERIPMISPASSSPEFIEGVDQRGLFFRMVPSAYKQVRVLAGKARTMGYKKGAVIRITDDENGYFVSQKFSSIFTTENPGFSVTDHLYTDPTQVTALLDEAAATNPEFIFLIAYGTEGRIILGEWARRYASIPLLLTDTLMSDQFLAGLDPTTLEALNTSVVNGVFPSYDISSDGYEAFIASYCKTFSYECACPSTLPDCDKTIDGQSPLFTPNAYDAIFTLALALYQTGLNNPNALVRGDGWNAVAVAENILKVINKNSDADVRILPGQWKEAVAAIQAGADINYDGASSFFKNDGSNTATLELDQYGDPTVGRFQFWTIKASKVAYTNSNGIPEITIE